MDILFKNTSSLRSVLYSCPDPLTDLDMKILCLYNAMKFLADSVLITTPLCKSRKEKAAEPEPSPEPPSTRQLRKNRVSRNFFQPQVWEKKPTATRQDSLKNNDRWFLLGNTFSVRSSSSYLL